MIHYSILPLENVFAESIENSIQTRIIEYKGCQVEAMVMQNGELQIRRILSTSPQDYLSAHLQPGNMIKI